MRLPRSFRIFLKKTPVIAGVLFCLPALVSCEKKAGTPTWPTALVSEVTTPDALPEIPRAEPSRGTPAPQAADAPTPARNGGFRFIAYNVKNWLTMDRYVEGRTLKSTPKPEPEKAAVIALLARHKPDVIGLCEIGTENDLREIQTRLKTAGIDLPHHHHTGGSDEVRHLGLLSRFPITATDKPENTSFRLQGRTFTINRGILDATITAHGKPYRFLGVHLKSKRDVKEADQEEMRRGEARLLRRHVDAILAEDPAARLIVYGDFNDSRRSTSFRITTGQYNAPDYLTPVPASDSRGHAWTYHWALHDIYSRIDYVTVTAPLKREVDFQNSYIADDKDWADASDHRPIVVIFR